MKWKKRKDKKMSLTRIKIFSFASRNVKKQNKNKNVFFEPH